MIWTYGRSDLIDRTEANADSEVDSDVDSNVDSNVDCDLRNWQMISQYVLAEYTQHRVHVRITARP